MGSDVSGSVGMESDGFGWILLCIKVKLDPNRSTRILIDLDGFTFLMFSMKDMCFIKSIIFVLMRSISICATGSTKWDSDVSRWILFCQDDSWWVQMKPYGSRYILFPEWSFLVQTDPYWSGWILIGPDGSWLVQMDPDGCRLIMMDTNVSRLILIGSDGFWCVQVDSVTSRWILTGLDGSWLVQMDPD